jgi:ABC-type nitrate/sulfonate/bicarbonate transport system permease component
VNPPTSQAKAAPTGSFNWLTRWATFAVVFLVWQFVAGYWLPKGRPELSTLLPPPSAIIKAAFEMIGSGELLSHLWQSLRRELIAFAFALSAVPIGIAMGWWKRVHEQLDPIIEILRPIPPIAWIPLSILWLGIGNGQNQFIIFLGIFFPLLINTIQGVKNIEPNLVRAARCLGASEWQILKRVVLPAALPQVLTGIRIGFGVGWMALVAAELVGASSGLGFLINDARSLLKTDVVILGMLTIGVVGLLIDLLIRKMAKRMLPWSLAAQK